MISGLGTAALQGMLPDHPQYLPCFLSAGCVQAAPDLSDSELQRLFAALDVDNTGSVDAQEFFAGVLQAALLPQQTHTVLEASFKLLDRWAGMKMHILDQLRQSVIVLLVIVTAGAGWLHVAQQ